MGSLGGHFPIEGVRLSGSEVGSNEPIAVLAMETPIAVMPGSVSQELLERAQLERFRSDYILRFGATPFEGVRRGADPPDFVVQREQCEVGVDCAALALETRRIGYAIFRRFREGLLTLASSGALEHLRGTVINVWFKGGDPPNQLPPKAGDDKTLEDLFAQLKSYRVDRELMAKTTEQIMQDGFPEQFPEAFMPIATNDGTAGCAVTPVPIEALSGSFSKATGFACEPAMSTYVSQSEIRAEMNRLIKQHDREGTTHLLLILGGPDRNGLRYPSESQLLSLLLPGDPITLPDVEHLKRVMLHCWPAGEIFDIKTSNP